MASSETPRGLSEPVRRGAGALPRGQLSEIQRGRILTAAVQVVEEVGYARMTVAQVVGRAKVSRKTFYDVFDDREDCFLAAFERAIEQARGLVLPAYRRERGWRRGMRASLERLLVLMDQEPGLARLCVIEALAAGSRVLDRRARLLGELAKVVDRGRFASAGASTRSPITAEGVVGGVFAVLHARLLEDREDEPLAGLLAQLMSMIVLPYLGRRAASDELAKPARRVGADAGAGAAPSADPLDGLDIRLTYRTVRVLVVIGARPGASNREIAEASGISDQGQISKLLMRLQRLQLIANTGQGHPRGAPNAWHLTERGVRVERATRALNT
jgi:AcrR family transcriptional regulator